MKLDWDKLRVFHAVAKAGSFTHAGDTLGISQSAISRQISTLEDSLGAPLFHRHARGLILTEQGELLSQATNDVYEKLVLIESKISDAKDKAVGPLKITISGFLGASWLAPKIRDFQALYPGLRLSIILDNKILNLSMREADVAIRMFEPDQPDLVKRLLTNVRCHICASKDYLKERGTPKKPIDLLDHMILGYPSSTPQPHAHTDWIFELAGIQKDAAYNVILMNSMYGIAQMTRRGAGVACLPDFMIEEHDELEVIMSEYEAPPIEVFFVYPEERRNSARIKALRDFLIETLKD